MNWCARDAAIERGAQARFRSNCVSVQPVETEFGRKRRIDQSSCNKDFSCVEGFCPSFVTVHGARLRTASGMASDAADPLRHVPDPDIPVLDGDGWSAIVNGIGGTGVVTVAAILGMAAHLEGKGCGLIDMAGLAQKGGAVFSHIRMARGPEEIHAVRVAAGTADLIIGCDLVVSGSRQVLGAVSEGRTLFVANLAEIMPGDFTRSADFQLPALQLRKAIRDAAGESRAHFFDATGAAAALFGNSIAANLFMLGFAFQHGGVPVSAAAIERAIELNGQAVAMNLGAFRWGRRAAHDPESVGQQVDRQMAPAAGMATTLDEIIDRRADFLRGYQNEAYAWQYRERVERFRHLDPELAATVARNLFRLMAVKDEYEVARLFAGAAFQAQLRREFSSWERLEFHLAPPVLGGSDAGGRPRKRRFGPAAMKLFALLAALRGLRGTRLDPFGYLAERRWERQLLADYLDDLDRIEASYRPDRRDRLLALAAIPARIRGYGPVKRANGDEAARERKRCLAQLDRDMATQVLPKAAE